MQDFEKYIQQSIEKQNRQGRAELEGYSPLEIGLMLYDFLNPKCPVQINLLQEEEYLEIPLFNQVKYLLQLIGNSGELKLTQRGNLPIKVVAELYKQGFLKDPWVEKGFAKVYNEEHHHQQSAPGTLEPGKKAEQKTKPHRKRIKGPEKQPTSFPGVVSGINPEI